MKSIYFVLDKIYYLKQQQQLNGNRQLFHGRGHGELSCTHNCLVNYLLLQFLIENGQIYLFAFSFNICSKVNVIYLILNDFKPSDESLKQGRNRSWQAVPHPQAFIVPHPRCFTILLYIK